MKQEKNRTAYKQIRKKAAVMVICVLTILVMAAGCRLLPTIGDFLSEPTVTTEPTTQPTTEAPTTEATEPPLVWETGFLAMSGLEVEVYDEAGALLGTVVRGTEVTHTILPDGSAALLVDEQIGLMPEGAYIVADPADSVPAHTLYVRTTVNLRDAEGRLKTTLVNKGAAVEVTGCDYVSEQGQAHMYRVNFGDEEGYIMPWYLAAGEEEALANYDDGHYQTHASRGNRYGGGGAADLDFFPREKGPIEGNPMPEECRTLYLVNWRIHEVDSYIEIARDTGVNAFVVDITDGGAIGYAGEVMKANCPSAAAAATNTVEEYQTAIQKLKDAGFYVIGRITTFNDTFYMSDHPELAITDTDGNLLKLSGGYWPSPYNRTAWQYKVDLAVEAVELMGFNEIQFDYVRFPDLTWRYEEAGTIDYHNTYGESKAQAIQRFLMYATDILHEKGVYVSADVYGESAYNYVTAYGQYWPAISNVVDAISGMPYPDHFSASGDYRPWEHPYDTLYTWGCNVKYRQQETATPAAVRTWIQAYNAIRAPYNTYGPEELAAQIRGLRDSGCTDGFMTWNFISDMDKYRQIVPVFTPPEEG